METEQANTLLNTGIYGIAEAARLTKVSPGRIRRWIRGLDFRKDLERRPSDAIWIGALSPMDGKVELGFLDLMEIRFVDAFLRAGVSWRTMKKAHQMGREEIGSEHPFCTNRFVTDGRRILLRSAGEDGDEVLRDLVSSQVEFQRIVSPFVTQLDFTEDSLTRWWPMGRKRNVVVDPARNLGQPTAAQSGVATEILARGVRANESVEKVAAWYEAEPDEVRDAVEFEASLVA